MERRPLRRRGDDSFTPAFNGSKDSIPTQKIERKPLQRQIRKPLFASNGQMITKTNPRGAGAESKLSPEVEEIILDGIRRGNYLSTMARVVGVRPGTLMNWKKWGKRDGEVLSEEEINSDRGKYFKFYIRLQQAEAECEEEVVRSWKDQIPGDWRAGEKFLSKRFPKKWAEKKEMALVGDPSRPIEVGSRPNLDCLSLEELLVLDKMRKKVLESNSKVINVKETNGGNGNTHFEYEDDE